MPRLQPGIPCGLFTTVLVSNHFLAPSSLGVWLISVASINQDCFEIGNLVFVRVLVVHVIMKSLALSSLSVWLWLLSVVLERLNVNHLDPCIVRNCC